MDLLEKLFWLGGQNRLRVKWLTVAIYQERHLVANDHYLKYRFIQNAG
jgi:hypothetical protein